MPQNRRDEGSGSDNWVQRDNQQVQDDNQTSGESVLAGQSSGDNQQPVRGRDMPNQAANKEKAEGSRENVNEADSGDAGGISNRPLSEEEGRQHNLPPRGEAKDGSHA
jgi:hypothetical protein